MSKPAKSATATATAAIPSLAHLNERIASMEKQREEAQARIADQRAKHREAVAESILTGQPRPTSPGLDAEEAELRRLDGDLSVLRDYIPRAKRCEAETAIVGMLDAYAADAEAHRRTAEGQMLVNFLPIIHAGYGTGDPATTAQAISREIAEGQLRGMVNRPARQYRETLVNGIGVLLRKLETDSRDSAVEARTRRVAAERIDAVERRFTPTDPDALLKRAQAIYDTIKAALIVT